MQSTTMTHAKLRLSESNVRKANGDAGLEALAASIAEHGLLQPLIVSPRRARRPSTMSTPVAAAGARSAC
jgi:ParB family chromosome partitioning protein